MKDSPRLSFSRFQTVTFTEKTNKNKDFQTPRPNRKLNRSGLLNPESALSHIPNLNMTIHHDRDVSLPAISSDKKKRKRGTFLESWLDEALGSADPSKPETAQNTGREVDGSNHKTLKKF